MPMRYHPYRRSVSSLSPKSSPRQSPSKTEYGFKVSTPSPDPHWNAFVGSIGGHERHGEDTEPDWNNAEGARSWLEHRYRPGDAALGSPLFQHITSKLRKPYAIPWGSTQTTAIRHLGRMLSNREMDKWIKQNPKDPITRSLKGERLYPDPPLPPNLSWSDPSCSFVDLDTAGIIVEPAWGNAAASRAWLEQRYRANDPSLGSPIFQYMKECYSGLRPRRSTPATWLGMMLSWDELIKWTSTDDDLTNDLTFFRDRETEPLYPDPPANNHQEELEDNVVPELSWTDPSCSLQDLDAAGLLVEPNWHDEIASKAWLENRYRSGDVSLGSPLLQYMLEMYNGPRFPYILPSGRYSCMLSFNELAHWSGASGHAIIWNRDRVPMYPDASPEGAVEAAAVARNRRKDRKPKPTPNRQVRTDREKRRDQKSYVGKLRSGVAKRKHKQPGMQYRPVCQDLQMTNKSQNSCVLILKVDNSCRLKLAGAARRVREDSGSCKAEQSIPPPSVGHVELWSSQAT